MTIDQFDKLFKSNEEFYFINTFEKVVFHRKPTTDPTKPQYMGKGPGQEPFEVVSGSKVFADALMERKTITEEEYNNF